MARKMARYERNWRALRAARINLYGLAIAGNTGAVDAIRTITLHAGVFAVLSVHNTVINQENEYGSFLAGIPIKGLAHHVNAASNVGAWLARAFDISLYRDRTGATLIDSLISIRGLGPAKATFMAALLAYDQCACIDVHMARMHGLPRQYANLTKYREAIAQSPFTHTLDQWRAFEIVPRFALTQHDIYFQSVLPLAYAAIAGATIAAPVISLAPASPVLAIARP